MASNTFRAPSLYVNSLKVAEISDQSFTVNGNVANQYGAEGVLGQSIGSTETKVDFGAVVPVQGMRINMKSFIYAGAAISLAILVDGKLSMIEGRLTEATYSGETKSGECKGKFSFIGGEPTDV